MQPSLLSRLLAAALGLWIFALVRAAGAQTSDQIVYDNALENGWVNYSWATVNFTNAGPVHSGAASIAVTAGAYQALYLHNSSVTPGAFTSLTFWINGGASGGQALQVQATVNGNAQPAVALAAPVANTWTQITLTLAQLGVANTAGFDGFWIQGTVDATEPVFYVDDISLVATPPPNPILLSVNAAAVTRTIDGRLFGLNTAIWDSELNTAATQSLLAAMGTTTLRFPGGSAADEYAWQLDRSVAPDDTSFTWASSYSSFAALASAMGAQVYLTVNYGSGTPQQAAAWVAYANGAATNPASLGTDSQGRNWLTVSYWASLRAAAPLATDDGYNFLRVSHAAPFAVKYWEVGNECYGGWERDDHGASGTGLTGTAHDPLTYGQAYAVFAQQMKAVDATIKVGVVGVTGEDSYGTGQNGVPNPAEGNSVHTGWTPVLLHTLQSLGVTPDFLIDHDYPQEPGEESDATLLQDSAVIAGDAPNLRGMINDYFGQSAGAAIELVMTESNSVSYNPGKQSTSLVNGLFRADTLGCLASTEFNHCDWWDLRNGSDAGENNSSALYGWREFGDYGVLASGDRSDTALNTPYPTYYAGKLLTHWAANGDSVLPAGSNYALLSIYATRRVDGSLALLVINKSPSSDLTAQIDLSGFTPLTAAGTWYRYGQPEDLANADLSTGTPGNAATTFAETFPSYSMTVLTLPAAGFRGWQQLAFTAAQLANPAISGPNADPDGDGIPNLLEYALNLNPLVANPPGSGITAGPITSNGAQALQLTYTQVKNATDLTYLVEVSADLIAWQSGSTYTQTVSTVDQGTTELVTVRDLTPISATNPHRFIRLRVVEQQ